MTRHGVEWKGRGRGAVYEWIFGFGLEPFYWHAETSLRWWRWYIFIPRSHVHIKKFEFEFKNVILWIIPRHVPASCHGIDGGEGDGWRLD